ncbi:amino acid ABC transporter membrane protein, PAAT family [Clostridium aceticum]|uniref:Amino acid ABC transporter membrane protein, PAAT family n=1 Tax=Clostridium aceticum TaxID=84022 RepID=A0A0D8IE66_9CLOT|nr:amino acid ABC transporter permease [Clostridium aceticum]AKL94000.1 amino acid ABC transporter membrane protein, PAAT family [Clostridium aceticum]KJF28620.1 ABC transporter permease [Clostridium aceticum]
MLGEIISQINHFIQVVITYAPRFLPGVKMTLQLSFFSILLGTVFGLVATMLKMTKIKPLMKTIDIYISIVRGTPLLLQLIFIFQALPEVGIRFSPFISAVIGLAFHNGAYISEIFRGAIESIDSGQKEAARSLGMTKWQAMRRVTLPQAFKRSVPALGNQFIIAIKDSSLASVITITEILMLTRQYTAATFNPWPMFFIAGCYYMIITIGLSKALLRVEKRLKVYER